ncbi:hypothetical protein BH11MYX3_BH11MYX3_10500 [soil metagenome]
MMKSIAALCVAALAGACVGELGDELGMSETQDALTSTNRLSSNRLSSNRLSSNRLSSNRLSSNSLEVQGLAATESGREVLSYIVGCALPIGQSLTIAVAGVTYTYPGWIGLAPGWATRVPTVSERRWVTSCLLSRTNVNGVPVNISMRNDSNLSLVTSAAERALYTQAEGSFYGDLFATVPVTYACSNRGWSQLSGPFRACALSPDGHTTDCGFTYTGSCASTTCTDKTAPFGGCKGGATVYSEVVTIFLTPSQQTGAPE